MGIPYAQQVRDQSSELSALLAPAVPVQAWLPPFIGPESGFRNKAKLAIGGTREAPTFGILDGALRGVDLRDCGLYEPALGAALTPLTRAVTGLGLVPFDVARRTGEFKHLLVTSSPDGEFMVRFVLRSPGQIPRTRRGLPGLMREVPGLRVVSVNIQPEHKAVLEGEEEIVLTEDDSLSMRLADLTLRLRPRSFFQTNSTVAAALYRQAREWTAQVDPQSVLDLYCGVGGFALSAALAGGRADRHVEGVEVSPDAVASASATAAQLDGVSATFRVGDARMLDEASSELVIVNPPRRGIGEDLCAAIEAAAPGHVIYSSCQAQSLAKDLAHLPGYRVRSARLFDMFPQTRHHEVIVLLERLR